MTNSETPAQTQPTPKSNTNTIFQPQEFTNYGFPTVKTCKVLFFPLTPPESDLPRSHYTGLQPSTTILPKGHVKEKGLRALPCEMIYERDLCLKMRDGVKVYTDVFRPSGGGEEKVPAILCYSPYGKTGTGYMNYGTTGPYNCGIPPSSLSGYHKFEAPDPAEWTDRGYAVINIDARGSYDSEGKMMRWGPLEALDCYDTIQWITEQSWSNGSVCMAGNSWLAVSQINVASREPHPALKCIAPWEGHSDHYRDVMVRGGIPSVGFGSWMQAIMFGRGEMEDTARMAIEQPLFNEYWEAKRIPVENIDIPIYQTASYSSFVHTHGSIRTFRHAKSNKKWLRIINAQEWADLYKPHNSDDLQKFFDTYCKGIENGWEKETSPVRISLISFSKDGERDVVERPEQEYPLARQHLETFHLDASSKKLVEGPVSSSASASYESHHLTDCLDFVLTFDEYTEIAGFPVVKLWMQCLEHDEMDIHVQLRKMDKDGNLLHHLNYPTLDGVEHGYDQDVNIFKFIGSTGALRASHHVSLNKKLSTINEPFYDHNRRELINPGTIIPLTIGIWPMGMVFDAGESLVLRVAGHQLVLPEFREMKLKEAMDQNKGRHVIHTGGDYDSHIMLPIIN